MPWANGFICRHRAGQIDGAQWHGRDNGFLVSFINVDGQTKSVQRKEKYLSPLTSWTGGRNSLESHSTSLHYHLGRVLWGCFWVFGFCTFYLYQRTAALIIGQAQSVCSSIRETSQRGKVWSYLWVWLSKIWDALVKCLVSISYLHLKIRLTIFYS